MSAVLRMALAQRYPEREAQAAAADAAACDQAKAMKLFNEQFGHLGGDDDKPDDGGDCTSFQRLGSTRVLVCYQIADDDSGAIVIDGALINGELVEADRFSASTLSDWERAICIEIADERDKERA